MQMWTELQDIMEGHIKKHKDLLFSLQVLRKAIMDRNLSEVEKTLLEQNKIKAVIEKIEKERARLCLHMERKYNLEAGASISELIEKAPLSKRRELSVLQEEFSLLLDQIKQETRVMRYVLHTVLKYVNDMIEVYTSSEAVVYDGTGYRRRNSKNIFLGRA